MKQKPVDPKNNYDRKKARRNLLLTHVPMLALYLYAWIKNGKWPMGVFFIEFFVSGLCMGACRLIWGFMLEDKYPKEDGALPDVTPRTVTRLEFPPKVSDEPDLNLWRFRCRKWLATIFVLAVVGWWHLIYYFFFLGEFYSR